VQIEAGLRLIAENDASAKEWLAASDDSGMNMSWPQVTGYRPARLVSYQAVREFFSLSCGGACGACG
jgi:hypothetical protein